MYIEMVIIDYFVFWFHFPYYDDQEYNKTLDTRLLYPVSRYHQDVEMVGHGADVEKVQIKLKEINRNYLEKSKLYDKYYENYQNASQDILLKRQVNIL